MQSSTQSVDELPKDFWIFGYGSLMWKNSDVPHVDSKLCFVRGYKRRAWQGSTDHRGTPEAPGRVVSMYTLADFDDLEITGRDTEELSLITDDHWKVYGLALKVTAQHREKVIQSLNVREIDGYEPVWLPLYLDVADDGGSDLFVPRALTYIASPKNPRFLGFLPHEQIAIHIAKCAGMSGPNLDYILNLNNALHTAGLPDPHLTSIAEIVRAKQARDASTNVGENDACSE